MNSSRPANPLRSNLWAVIPAAGCGSRMGSPTPKQYLPLAGRPVLEHTVERLVTHPAVCGLIVVLSPGDSTWERLDVRADKPVLRVDGGAERCHSVLNALEFLSQQVDPDDWVLVHDAARPCLQRSDLDKLVRTLTDHPVGGLLGVPVRDTMKRTDRDGVVQETIERSNLWHALTPQMFRFGLLLSCLRSAIGSGALVTDEASAVELAGMRPLMVEGRSDNIKITRPEDLAVAEFFIREQERTTE